MSTKGGPVLTFILPWGGSSPCHPRQLCHWSWHWSYRIDMAFIDPVPFLDSWSLYV